MTDPAAVRELQSELKHMEDDLKTWKAQASQLQHEVHDARMAQLKAALYPTPHASTGHSAVCC